MANECLHIRSYIYSLQFCTRTTVGSYQRRRSYTSLSTKFTEPLWHVTGFSVLFLRRTKDRSRWLFFLFLFNRRMIHPAAVRYHRPDGVLTQRGRGDGCLARSESRKQLFGGFVASNNTPADHCRRCCVSRHFLRSSGRRFCRHLRSFECSLMRCLAHASRPTA